MPPLTRERLLDAEIQWYMLQRFPRMDAVGLAVTYQKLLDSLIDVSIVVPLREFLKRRSTRLPDHPTPLERDILKLTERQYHLSFGRLYELIQMFRNQKTTPFLSQLEHFLIEHNHTFYRFITSL